MNAEKGFTLIELMIVVAIIGILASIALPEYSTYIQRSQVTEALNMASGLKPNINSYYSQRLAFPANNKAAGMPEPQFLIGNYIKGVTVEAGAIHITLGNKIPEPLQDKVLTFRPAVVTGSPTSPITWLCGYDKAVTGMSAVGENKTDIDNTFLPLSCRG